MANFTYTRGIPSTNNNPSEDQPNMQINNDSIDDILEVDHVSFEDTNGGTHKQVTLTNEAAPGLNGCDGVLYANLASSESWPFWQNALGSFQMIGKSSAVASGYATLPGGVILQWGSVTSAAGRPTVNTQAFNIDFPTAVFAMAISTSRDNTDYSVVDTIYIVSKTAGVGSNFTYVSTSGSNHVNFNWIALGN